MTFTLTGFSTVKRDGIELSGSFTATINADMKVGALEETITVTGETPIVDVQSVAASDDPQRRDVIKAMPAARLRRHHGADSRPRSRRRAPTSTCR